jgi:hypothetical protein
MKFVVTGAAGHVSKPLTELLLKKGHDVTVVGRNPKNLEGLVKLGAKTAIGDMGNVPFLTETFKGADGVYLMLPCRYSQFRMLRKHWSFATTALSWPPCLRSCPQWFLWSPSGFGVEPLWNWRCSLSDIRWPFSIGSGQAERGLVQVTAYCGPGSTELGRAV